MCEYASSFKRRDPRPGLVSSSPGTAGAPVCSPAIVLPFTGRDPVAPHGFVFSGRSLRRGLFMFAVTPLTRGGPGEPRPAPMRSRLLPGAVEDLVVLVEVLRRDHRGGE